MATKNKQSCLTKSVLNKEQSAVREELTELEKKYEILKHCNRPEDLVGTVTEINELKGKIKFLIHLKYKYFRNELFKK